MFDVLDIQAPSIPSRPSGPIKSATTVGADNQLYAGSVLLGTIVPVSTAYSHDWWVGEDESRMGWMVLLASQAAEKAAEGDREWTLFVSGLREVLSSSPDWRSIAESDCDQHPLTRLESADEFINSLNSARSGTLHPLAVVAEAGRGRSVNLRGLRAQ